MSPVDIKVAHYAANRPFVAEVMFLGGTFSLYDACTVDDMTAFALAHMSTVQDEETIRKKASVVLERYLERYKEHWPTIYARGDLALAAVEAAELVVKLGTKGAVKEAARMRKAAVASRATKAAPALEACDPSYDGHDREAVGVYSDEDSPSSSDSSSSPSDDASSSSSSDGSTGLEDKVPLLIV